MAPRGPWGGACALAALLASAGPVQAAEYGGWYARLSLDGWHDDNLARSQAPSPTRFPRGNQDVGANLGFSLGSVWLLAPRWDLWVTASAQTSRAVLYPEWSSHSASLYADLSCRLDQATQAYIALGGSSAWAGSPYGSAEAGLARQLWPGATVQLASGFGLYWSDRPELRTRMPALSLGLQQRWPTGTRVVASYGYQYRLADTASGAQHQLYLLLGQRLAPLLELRLRYLQSLATAGGPSPSGYATLGLVLDL